MPVIPPNSANGSVSLRRVSLVRADAALQKVAIFASVNLIATMASTLPWAVFRGVGADKTMISSPPWLDDPGGDGHGLSDFLWQLYFCWCLRGNVVGIGLERSPQTNQFTRIVLQHPDDVSVQVDPEDATRVVWRANGKEIPSGQVWHRRVYPAPGRALGLSPIALHALTISEGLHAQNFATQFFLDGAHPSAVLTNVNARRSARKPPPPSRSGSWLRSAAPANRRSSPAAGITSRSRSRRPSRSSSRRRGTRRPSAPGSTGRGCLRFWVTRRTTR
jgi:phage portal protein BeeE